MDYMKKCEEELTRSNKKEYYQPIIKSIVVQYIKKMALNVYLDLQKEGNFTQTRHMT
jgi:hypothetical protein